MDFECFELAGNKQSERKCTQARCLVTKGGSGGGGGVSRGVVQRGIGHREKKERRNEGVNERKSDLPCVLHKSLVVFAIEYLQVHHYHLFIKVGGGVIGVGGSDWSGKGGRG